VLPESNLLRKAIVVLISLETGDTFPPSREFEVYSEQVKMDVSRLSEAKAREFILDLWAISMTLNVAKWVALYPALKEFASRFPPTPELLVTLFTESSTVGDTEGAGDYLRKAYDMDPSNEFVLWQLLVGRGSPWFPKDLVSGPDPYTDELSVVERLLKRNPNDPLALSVEMRLRATGKSLSERENIPFFNSLSRMVPHPLRNDTIEHILRTPTSR